ncbi:unnamed protein product [Boreogadus saida]
MAASRRGTAQVCCGNSTPERRDKDLPVRRSVGSPPRRTMDPPPAAPLRQSQPESVGVKLSISQSSSP